MSEQKLRPPSRRVPLGLKIRTLLKEQSIICFLIGFIVVGFASNFVLANDRPMDFLYVFGMGENVKNTEGFVDKCSSRTVVFHYEVDGVKFKGKGHRRRGRGPSAGSKVQVLYSVKHPSISKLDGFKRKPKYWPANYLFLFVGIALVWSHFPEAKHSMKTIDKLLKNGIILNAAYTGKSRATSIRVNKQPVFEFYFETEPWKEIEKVFAAKKMGTQPPDPGESIQALVYPKDEDIIGIDISELIEKEGLSPSGDWPSTTPWYWYLPPILFFISLAVGISGVVGLFSA